MEFEWATALMRCLNETVTKQVTRERPQGSIYGSVCYVGHHEAQIIEKVGHDQGVNTIIAFAVESTVVIEEKSRAKLKARRNCRMLVSKSIKKR